MNQKRAWSYIGIFVIALVISIPFYVADAYAVSVKVTKNQGEKGIEGFINAQKDNWKVEAVITGTNGTAEAGKVKIKVGEQEAEFSSCDSGGAFGTSCTFENALPNGIGEGRYSFKVLYYFLNSFGVEEAAGSALKELKADGSGPLITINKAWQAEGKVHLDFLVKDEPSAACVGLEKIEILDEEGGVLETISEFEAGDCELNFVSDKGGILEGAVLSGEGRKTLKIKARDRLGNEKTAVKTFDTDFIAPVIESFELTDLGEFIGQVEVKSDVLVKVKEKEGGLKVKASSEQIDFNEQEGDCVAEEEEGEWSCKWEKLEIIPSETVTVKFTAEDGRGNRAEKSLSKSLVVDKDKPKIIFLGTERTFNGVSYVKEGKNTIILEAEEKGAGISSEGIRANLVGLGGEAFDKPGECNETEGRYNCYWDVSRSYFSTDKVLVGLSYFKDKAGNEGQKQEVEVKVDKNGPKIEKMEVYGIGEAGKKNYFQSGDSLGIEMEIGEASGLLVLVNLNDLVTDAELKFPTFGFGDLGEYTGWQSFNEENCVRKEGKWACKLEISEKIKSGYDASAELKIEIYDTAGNKAKWMKEPKNVKSGAGGDYKLELLGVEAEEEPDYWSVDFRGIRYAPKFIDLETTQLINTRVAATVPLKSDEAIAKKIDLIGCSAGGDNSSKIELKRKLIYGGISETEGKATPTIVLEFEAFSANETLGTEIAAAKAKGKLETIPVKVNCQLKIYSQVGNKAIGEAEAQSVELSVSFGYSELGAQDENLESKVNAIKNEVWFVLADKISFLNKIVQWVKYVADIAQLVLKVNNIINIFNVGGDVVRAAQPVIGNTIATAICKTGTKAQQSPQKWIQYFQIPLQILSCNPAPKGTLLGNTWYSKYQQTVLNYYNLGTGRVLFPAKSLYDNIYLSFAGLCLPGILYNLEKYRQIRCREIICLQKEVPKGIATVSSCTEMGSRLQCEYFIGPAIQFIPGASLFQEAAKFIKSWFESPVGLVKIALVLLCVFTCPYSNKATVTCNISNFVIQAGDILEIIVGAFKNRPDITSDPYCSQIK